MVVDNNRIAEPYTTETVKNILSDYSDRRKAEAVFETRDEELEFLRKCLKYLDDGERDILEKTFFEGVSIREYSRRSGFSRNFISRRRDKSVALLTKFFNLKFG